MNLHPVVSVTNNPLAACPTRTYEVSCGQTLIDLSNEAGESRGLRVCRINGGPDYVHREDWNRYRVEPGDVIEFIDYPQGTLLIWEAIALLAVSVYMISRIKRPNQVDSTRENVYNTSLSGNLAKPDSPISKICGRMRTQPPFAGTPYGVYNSSGDQIYYALLAIGVGDYDIERDMIDDTPISHFADVTTHQYLAPGVQPAYVKANVVTAPEVSGQDMLTGQYIGGFTACGPGFTVASVELDLVANKGLGHQEDDGSMSSKSVQWQVDWRLIDQFGSAITPWANLAIETKSAATTKVQRWSFKYTIPTLGRPQVRVRRLDVKSENLRDAHDLMWEGMKAYLHEPAPLNPNVAHYEVVMRSSQQLNSQSQRSITLIVQAKARTLNSSLVWQPATYTRNPAWWILDLATSNVWGPGLPDSRIDLQSFYDYAMEWDERQDRFDYEFSATTDAWEAMQLIATAGRAKVFRRYGILSICRDELAIAPVTAFTARNTEPHSMVMDQTMPTSEMPDGYVIEYLNYTTWLWTSIYAPCDGVVTMQRPIHLKLEGVTGPTHATREAKYYAAKLLYRRRIVNAVTEMHGMLPSYGAPVRWMPEVYGYGQTGDVVAWDPSTLRMTLSEPPKWSDSNYLSLMRDDGTLTDPIEIAAGDNDHEVVLSELPDFIVISDDSTRERPRFLFGKLNTSDELVKITAIGDGGLSDEGASLLTIQGEIDDARVHSADNDLLPVGDEVQDPVLPADEGGDVDIPIVNLNDRNIGYVENSVQTIYRVYNTGESSRTVDGVEVMIPSEWLFVPTVSTSADDFEIRVTPTDGALADVYGSSDSTGIWLNLGTNHEWRVEVPVAGLTASCTILVEVRDIATSTIQDFASISLVIPPAAIGE